MLFKLAWKNIIKKPFKAIAIVLAIAMVVAMFFSILSFNEVVYEYLFKQKVAMSGDTDLLISITGDSERILDPGPLTEIDKNGKPIIEGIGQVVPSLSLYARYKDQYVKIRGFDENNLDKLNPINVYEGSLEKLNEKPNGVAISRRTAEAFDLHVGDRVLFELGTQKKSFYVQVIAENDGYFLTDEVYTFIGTSKGGVSNLVSQIGIFYNEIYVGVEKGYNIDEVIENIKGHPAYSNKSIMLAVEEKDVRQNATSLFAPIAIAGGTVAFLGMTLIYVLFVLSEKDRRQYASKLGIIGASRGQIFKVFLLENLLLAAIGVIIGSALAVGVFVGVVKLTISQTMAFEISALKLFGAAMIGLVLSIVCSLFPLIKAFKSSVKENLMQLEKKSKWNIVLTILFSIVFIITVIVEFTVPETIGYLSIVNIILLLIVLAFITPHAMVLISKLLKKSSNVSVKIASNNLVREKRNSRTSTLMAVGMIVSMLLFMAWDISTQYFTGYKEEISDMIYIQNVQEDVDLEEFRQIEGVDIAEKMLLTHGTFKCDGDTKLVKIIGTKYASDLFGVKFITPKDEIKKELFTGEKTVIVNENLLNLYGLKVGDSVSITMDEKEETFTIGGVVSSMIFGGNFFMVSEDVIKEVYNIPINHVVVRTRDLENTANRLQEHFSPNNYFVITALELSSWTDRTTDAIFKLVGTIAGAITVFIFISLLAGVVVSRTNSEKIRRALLATGMSKNDLLLSEIMEHFTISMVAFILTFALSPLITACLIHALKLFGLWFGFMYNPLVVALCGLAFVIAYTITPLVLNFKGGYKLKVRE